MDAAELALLVFWRGDPAGLVVGDDQAAVVVELEPVDDAAQRRSPTWTSSLQLDADGVMAVGSSSAK